MGTVKTMTVAAVTAALALSGCGGSSHPAYPANVQANFLNACEVQGNVTACDCALKHIEARVTVARFQADENALKAGGATPSWATSAIAACT